MLHEHFFFLLFFFLTSWMIFSYVFPTVFDLISHLDSPSGVYFILIKQVFFSRLYYNGTQVTCLLIHVYTPISEHLVPLPVLGNVGPHRRDWLKSWVDECYLTWAQPRQGPQMPHNRGNGKGFPGEASEGLQSPSLIQGIVGNMLRQCLPQLPFCCHVQWPEVRPLTEKSTDLSNASYMP